MAANKKPAKSKGLTLIEAVVVIAILGILIAISLPSFQQSIKKSRIVGASDNILADLRFAQTESQKRNEKLYFIIIEGSNWSYSICTLNTSPCAAPIKSGSHADYKDVTVTANTTGDTITFDPKRSTIEEAASSPTPIQPISINSDYGIIKVEISNQSSIKLCSPTQIRGYASCYVGP